MKHVIEELECGSGFNIALPCEPFLRYLRVYGIVVFSNEFNCFGFKRVFKKLLCLVVVGLKHPNHQQVFCIYVVRQGAGFLPVDMWAGSASAPAPPPEVPLRWKTWQTAVDAAEDRPSDVRRIGGLTCAAVTGVAVAALLLITCPIFVAKPRVSRFEAPHPNPLRVLAWATVAAAIAAVVPIVARRRRQHVASLAGAPAPHPPLPHPHPPPAVSYVGHPHLATSRCAL